MPTARHWHGGRLLLSWAVSLAFFATLKLSLIAGTYQAAIVDQRVTRVSGLWSPTFASNVSLAVLGGGGVTLVWMTVTWVRGRRERARLRASQSIQHRDVLM